jgi:hypothetical protein
MGNPIYVFSTRGGDDALRASLDAVPKGEFSDVCRKALTLWFSVDRSTVADQLSDLRDELAAIKRMLEHGATHCDATYCDTSLVMDGESIRRVVKQLEGLGI